MSDDGRKLRRRSEYRAVYDGGVRVAGRHVVLFARARDGESRVGITATRRLGGAVVRNRARRRVRELLRRAWPSLVGLHADVVVNLRSGCVGAPWTELEADLANCLQRMLHRLPRREAW